MTAQEKMSVAIGKLQSERKAPLTLTDDERAEAIADLVTRLSEIPRGERSNKDGRKIRTSLRRLGFFISKQ